MFLLVLFTLFSDYPDWFYNPPENTVAVIIKDQYTVESRFLELYIEANRLLKLEQDIFTVVGYEAYRESNHVQSRYDKFVIEYDFTDTTDVDYVDQLGYHLLEMKRYPKDVVIGLFGKPETAVTEGLEEDEYSEPDWLNEGSSNLFSIGFSSEVNYFKTSSWESAFKHALYQLTMNNNLLIYGDVDQRKYETDRRIIDQRTDEQLNLVKYEFSGIRISHRFFDPTERVYYIKIETK